MHSVNAYVILITAVVCVYRPFYVWKIRWMYLINIVHEISTCKYLFVGVCMLVMVFFLCSDRSKIRKKFCPLITLAKPHPWENKFKTVSKDSSESFSEYDDSQTSPNCWNTIVKRRWSFLKRRQRNQDSKPVTPDTTSPSEWHSPSQTCRCTMQQREPETCWNVQKNRLVDASKKEPRSEI